MKKYFKRISALLIAAIMVLGLCTTAFAAGNVTVSLPSGAEDATIKYGQIIVEDRTSDLGWKFVSSIETAFVNAYGLAGAHAVISDLISIGALENTANANVSSGKINSSEALGRALEAVKGIATTQASSTFSLSDIGLYVITAEKEGYTFIPMAAYVGTNFTGLNVTAKGSKDQITKTVNADGKSVSKGDVVTYTVTARYPYYSANATNKKFEIKDTLSNATVKEVSSITIGGVLKTEICSISGLNTNVLTLDFGGSYYNKDFAGKEVVITYTATVGDVSSTQSLKNDVKSTIATGATEYIVESDTVKFIVTKVDSDNNNTVLSGAEFTVYEEVTADTDGKVELKYTDPETNAEVTVYAKIVATVSTENDGTATFDGLDAQKTYYVAETKAPEGYSLNTTVYKLSGATEKEGSGTSTATESDGITTITTKHEFNDFASQTVTDTKLSALPSTGGIGTTIFTVVGCLIMIAAAVMFFVSRRRTEK